MTPGGSGARAAQAATFLAVAGVLVLYALRGGTFDVVPRAELGIAAWWALGLGWATGVLPRARFGGWALAPLAGLVLLAAWTALSLTWTESAERTGGELARLAHHVGLLALALSLVGPRTWRAAAGRCRRRARWRSARSRSRRGCGPPPSRATSSRGPSTAAARATR